MRVLLLVAGLVSIPLSGCVTEREAIITYYTQSDIDAITMRLQCQRLARNSFQLSLCDPIRR